VIKQFIKNNESKQVDILEGLSATGLRSIRYLNEIPQIRKLIANDISPVATEIMRMNFEFNECDSNRYEVSTNDAIELMYDCKREKRTFDIVDLDPYGSSLPFLENALNIVEHGGLLCSTFTDMRVLCA